MSAVEAASIVARVALRDEASQGLRNINNQAQGVGGQLRAMGGNIQNFGGQLTAAFAAPAVAIGYAVNQTRTFDRTFSNVNSILQLGTDEAAALRAELLAFGSGTVAGPQATAEAYLEIASGVADTSTHMAILTAATATAEAGQADLGATTSALISIMNSYGFSADQASFASDVLSRTVGMGVGSMEEFAAAFPQVTGLASQFGIGLDGVGSSLAYLTTQGFTASQSATFLKAMITTLLSPTADLSTAIQELGYESGAALIESQGLVGAYSMLAQHNGGLDGLITNTEALQGALALTNDGATSFFDTYEAGVAGATASAGLIQDQTEGWDLMRSALDGLAITAGSTLAPVLTSLIQNQITPAIGQVTEWIAANPQLTMTIMGIIGALAIAGPIIGGVGTLITIIGGALTAASFAAGGLTIALGILTSPIVAIGLLIAGVVWAINNPAGLISALNTASINARNLVQQLGEIVRLVSDDLYDIPQHVSNMALGQTQRLGGGGAPLEERAIGGPVMARSPYLVGERGPELFVPSSDGQIVNNSDLQSMQGGGGGGVVIQQVVIHANTEAGGRAAYRGFNEELKALQRSKGVSLNG